MENSITKEQIELVERYVEIFYKAYVLATGKKLTSYKEVLDLINSGRFTFEDDVWGIYLDNVLSDLDEQEQEYFDNNIDSFFCEVYFPEKTKTVGDGAWVKIRTEKGFEVHWAKRSMRKRRWEEELVKNMRKQIVILKDKRSIVSDAKKLKTPQSELMIRSRIGLRPYEIRINRTKSKKEFYLTNQYEIVKDIELFSEAYVDGIAGVYKKSLYTSQNEDAIFYLTTRGIGRKAAEMMAALKQTYFIVNMEEAITEFNNQFKIELV